MSTSRLGRTCAVLTAVLGLLISSVALIATGAPASAAAQVVSDGGFEAGGVGWAFTDNHADGGSPRCTTDPTTSCGTGAVGTAVPHTGNAWLWFGGVTGSGPHTGSATQSVTLPEYAATTTLSFYARVGRYTAGENATLQVRYDGVVVATLGSTGEVSPTYSLRTIALPPAQAAGSTHTLSLSYLDPEISSYATIHVDDIALTTSPTPETLVAKAPDPRIRKNHTKIVFGSSAPGSTYVCKVDRRKAKPCTSPLKLTKLKRGLHTVVIAATASGVADPTPAVVEFRVKPGGKRKR